jgi:mannose-1-phosphate guanylyltransferase
LATAHVAKAHPQGVVVVLPSDQHVSDVARFSESILKAASVAQEGHIVTLGIRPSRPDTGFGYIRLGQPLPSHGNSVAAFVEKPTLSVAQEYLASGQYLWNAGIFVFRADVMMQAFETFMPELFGPLSKISKAIGTRNYAKVLEREFKKMPSISIDYGIAERAPNMAVVPGDFGWSDVGSFNALPEVRNADDKGNVLLGKGALAIDCEGCVVVSQERPVSVVGMKDVVVVDAQDAILVIPKDKSQEVRKVVEELKRRKWVKYL